MRRLLVALAVVALLPALPAKPLAEPVIVYADDHGSFLLGVPLVTASTPADALYLARIPFSTDDCHRSLRLRLDYQPMGVMPSLGPLSAAVAFTFELRLLDAATGAAVPGSTMSWTSPGTKSFDLLQPRGLVAELALRQGANVTYDLRISGNRDLTADCRWQGLVFVNEIESNPAGTDAGNEAVELLNAGFEAVDLSGWRLDALHGSPDNQTLPSGTVLEVGQRLVVQLPGQFLDNQDEVVTLTMPSGWEVDRTPPLSDDANDGMTWQRIGDASETWTFAPGTLGAHNA